MNRPYEKCQLLYFRKTDKKKKSWTDCFKRNCFFCFYVGGDSDASSKGIMGVCTDPAALLVVVCDCISVYYILFCFVLLVIYFALLCLFDTGSNCC